MYTRQQLESWLGNHVIQAALPYVANQVKIQQVNSVYCSGVVTGTQCQPYHVEVFFNHAGMMVGQCTCPMGQNCKHVGALLLANLESQILQRASKKNALSPSLQTWLDSKRTSLAGLVSHVAPKVSNHVLVYCLHTRNQINSEGDFVELYKAKQAKDGVIRDFGQIWNGIDRALGDAPPQFVQEHDIQILRVLCAGRNIYGRLLLRGHIGSDALQRMLATGRLYLADRSGEPFGAPLSLGQTREAHVAWRADTGNMLRSSMQASPPAVVLSELHPMWYADANNCEVGEVHVGLDAKRIRDFLAMPPFALDEAPVLANALQEIAPDIPLPPSRESGVDILEVEPQPIFNIYAVGVSWVGAQGYLNSRLVGGMLDYACVSFDYGEFNFVAGSSQSLVQNEAGKLIEVQRAVQLEKKYLAELQGQFGMRSLPKHYVGTHDALPDLLFILPTPDAWLNFIEHDVPRMQEQGWRIEHSFTSRYTPVIDIDDIDGQVSETGDGWFDIEMGIRIGDRKVRLEPLLAELFLRDPRWLDGQLETIADEEKIELKTEQHERLRMRAERLKPLVRILIDLFDQLGANGLRVSRFDAARLEALYDTGRWQFHGDDSVRALAQKLRDAAGVHLVAVPTSLQAQLRPYQHQGVSWMQFLRTHNLSGVLADDMGLGKTLQALAHILIEKEAGRLDLPAIIVLPTSLVHNWLQEAARFTPTLRVLNLHGGSRKERFDEIAAHDVVLTTYSLLWRDIKVINAHEYHLLILDEAQVVKNATTKASDAIRNIRVRHRLCLTGTPLENHLGELWSLFDFLLPGFLGSPKDFAQRWRVPIEKGRDGVRSKLLARRIKPFMLRRSKDEVARDLPAKTIIVRDVEIEGAQRDLYETVRSAMQSKVRDAIAAQGLNRSQIVLLDALLKLRQVCCDPRLVKLTQADKVKESAKLEMLMEMLPELIAEGRRILLFSQFTSMLDLIAEAVQKCDIDYVSLRGDTVDRVTPITRFQNGEVPLFLISLKAGGVGLNLTAADTVIHYDPWWNPAVENQATDRAHRLGQDKPVFVYKLIVAGSIEEKIMQLQQNKATLARSILSEDTADALKFSDEDLEALFAPISDLT